MSTNSKDVIIQLTFTPFDCIVYISDSDYMDSNLIYNELTDVKNRSKRPWPCKRLPNIYFTNQTKRNVSKRNKSNNESTFISFS